jgi:hypothetical protein
MTAWLDNFARQHLKGGLEVERFVRYRIVEQPDALRFTRDECAATVDGSQEPFGRREDRCAQLLPTVTARIERLGSALELSETCQQFIAFSHGRERYASEGARSILKA